MLKIGGGWLGRSLNAALTVPRGVTSYHFSSLDSFKADAPSSVTFATTRAAPDPSEYLAPNPNLDYQYGQYFLFVQDSVRVTPRLLLNGGVRYEFFGAPTNVGSEKDSLVQLGPGTSFPERLSSAAFSAPGPGNQPLYSTDRSNWGARAGFALNLQRNGKSIFRGGYGIFYDRPFDNLWLDLSLNNTMDGSASFTRGATINYLQPLQTVLANVQIDRSELLPLAFFQPGLHTPYAHSFFAGIQQAISSTWSIDVNYSGSLGRRLLTTDLVNRIYSTCPPHGPGICRYNPNYNDDFAYLANEGGSDYHALTASSSLRLPLVLLGVNYTWSHAIDNQTEPLAGLAANLEVASLTGSGIQARPAQFTEQFNSRGDRGSSDFDQRHNLTFYSTWSIPVATDRWAGLWRGWRISQIGAIRSGQPYTVYASGIPDSSTYAPNAPGVITYNRADLVASGSSPPTCMCQGGVRLLNPNDFADPVNALGNTTRNEFRGPGLYSIDLSLSRTFALPWISEAGRLILRADAYNALNHANLNNPSVAAVSYGSQTFGVALYGRQDIASSLPVASPLNETARQLQLMLKIVF